MYVWSDLALRNKNRARHLYWNSRHQQHCTVPVSFDLCILSSILQISAKFTSFRGMKLMWTADLHPLHLPSWKSKTHTLFNSLLFYTTTNFFSPSVDMRCSIRLQCAVAGIIKEISRASLFKLKTLHIHLGGSAVPVAWVQMRSDGISCKRNVTLKLSRLWWRGNATACF